jgi:hypothetical protein
VEIVDGSGIAKSQSVPLLVSGALAGDYNVDGAVNQDDHAFWRAHFASTSGIGLQADGNGNGVVDVADYVVWRNNVTGDYNGDATVDPEDYGEWKSNFGFTSNHAADGNRDGAVDAADYVVWRNILGSGIVTRPAGDYDIDGNVNENDRGFWRANFGSTSGVGLQADGNGNGIVDSADYVVWRNYVEVAQSAKANYGPIANAAYPHRMAAGSSAPAVDKLMNGFGLTDLSVQHPSKRESRSYRAERRDRFQETRLSDSSKWSELLLQIADARESSELESEIGAIQSQFSNKEERKADYATVVDNLFEVDDWIPWPKL